MYLFIVYLICIFGGYTLILTGMSCLKMLLFKFILFNDRIKTHKTKEKKKTCNLLCILNGMFWALRSHTRISKCLVRTFILKKKIKTDSIIFKSNKNLKSLFLSLQCYCFKYIYK